MNKVYFEQINTGFYRNKKTGKKCEVSCFLVKHPNHGYILFDTGFSEELFRRSNNFLYSIYKNIVEFNFPNENSTISQLKKMGISPNEIKYIIISHFHLDNICSLKDFPNAKYICSKKAFSSKNYLCIRPFIKTFMPEDFIKNVLFVENFAKKINVNHFKEGYDIFFDNSLYLVSLEGHTEGQLGLIMENIDNIIFLVGDSVYSNEEYKRNYILNNSSLKLFSDKIKYQDTLGRMHRFYLSFKDLKIIPSHNNI